MLLTRASRGMRSCQVPGTQLVGGVADLDRGEVAARGREGGVVQGGDHHVEMRRAEQRPYLASSLARSR